MARIAGVNIPTNKRVIIALQYIHGIGPKKAEEIFLKQDPDGNLDRIYATLIPQAPAIKQAEAKLHQARRDLELAKLDLGAGLKHHLIPVSWVATVDDKVHLSLTKDEAKAAWREKA